MVAEPGMAFTTTPADLVLTLTEITRAAQGIQKADLIPGTRNRTASGPAIGAARVVVASGGGAVL